MIRFWYRVKLERFIQREFSETEFKFPAIYMIADDKTVFYIGESMNVPARIYTHMGLSEYNVLHPDTVSLSDVGKCILANIPMSLKWIVKVSNPLVELVNEENFYQRGLIQALERELIKQHNPCFNKAFNPTPALLPAHLHASL